MLFHPACQDIVDWRTLPGSTQCLDLGLASMSSGARRSKILQVVDKSEGAICRRLCATAFVHGAQPSIVVESRPKKSINKERGGSEVCKWNE